MRTERLTPLVAPPRSINRYNSSGHLNERESSQISYGRRPHLARIQKPMLKPSLLQKSTLPVLKPLSKPMHHRGLKNRMHSSPNFFRAVSNPVPDSSKGEQHRASIGGFPNTNQFMPQTFQVQNQHSNASQNQQQNLSIPQNVLPQNQHSQNVLPQNLVQNQFTASNQQQPLKMSRQNSLQHQHKLTRQLSQLDNNAQCGKTLKTLQLFL